MKIIKTDLELEGYEQLNLINLIVHRGTGIEPRDMDRARVGAGCKPRWVRWDRFLRGARGFSVF